MSDDDESDSSERLPFSLNWMVSCPRHGTRAHLSIEVEDGPAELTGCSLLPGQIPPSCDRACMGALTVSPTPEADDLDETEELDQAP